MLKELETNYKSPKVFKIILYIIIGLLIFLILGLIGYYIYMTLTKMPITYPTFDIYSEWWIALIYLVIVLGLIGFCVWGFARESKNVKNFTNIMQRENLKSNIIEWQIDLNRSLQYFSLAVIIGGKPKKPLFAQ